MNIEHYIDGFLVPVPRAHLDDYRAVSSQCAPIWKEHGALAYVETVLDDDSSPEMRPFPTAADAKEDEVVIFSWIVYPSKAVRDEANTKIMADPRLAGFCEKCQNIFDSQRMSVGGFRPLVVL